MEILQRAAMYPPQFPMQGSVLGPILYLIYITDINKDIIRDIRLFTDYTILYRPINSDKDAASLQEHLNWLDKWIERVVSNGVPPSQLQTASKSPVVPNCTLHGYTLEKVDKVRYLCVTFPVNLKWDRHMTNDQMQH